MQKLRELSRKVLGPGGLDALLQEIMDVAVEIMGANQGTLQLLEGNSLRIAAQRGHTESFLKFFASAETVASSCWEAARRGDRVVVPDVENSELFAGTESLTILRAAGVRSLQSTPMVSRTGKSVGILSTHWSQPHCPDERDLSRMDLLVRQAADLIEVARAEVARAEEALRASESTLVFHSAPLMMGLVEVPADNSDIIHVYDNPATDRFFGRKPGSTVGQSALGRGVPVETLRRWIGNYRLAERHGKPVQFEYWHPLTTGAVWLSAAVALIGPGDSGRTRFSYAVADMTERKRMEDALRTSEEQLIVATLGGNLGIWAWDSANDVASLSGKYYEMTGYEEGEVQTNREFFRRLIHPEDLPAVKSTMADYLQGQSDHFVSEYRMRRKTGEYRWVRVVGKVVARDGQGAPLRMAGVIADITARKKAEAVLREQLAHASRVSTVGELASAIIHELNQPLGSILCNLDTAELFLNQSPPDLGQLRDILSDIRNANQRAAEVLRGMRTFLLKHEIDPQPLEINLLAEEVLQFVKEDAVSRKIKITTEFSPQLPAVRGNRAQLQQVVLNFVMNAMDAMAGQPSERRCLTVGTSLAADGGVKVSVSDLGSGIEPSNLPRLFQPFFTTKKSGLGIGLSVAEKIATAHSGRVWAENRPAGGAMFHLVLPAGTGQAQVF
jgi:PAS domain S-box-containing protein